MCACINDRERGEERKEIMIQKNSHPFKVKMNEYIWLFGAVYFIIKRDLYFKFYLVISNILQGIFPERITWEW